MLPNSVKMVIWDLDETFWHGTLTEGGATIVPHNVDLVVDLCKRGIISSICSKNTHADARRVLEEHKIWDYFVFPRIEFAPKGQAIAGIIDQANLRPDNVLFIDDNTLNLEEAKHYAPNIMTALPDQILPVLLTLPQTRGKDDWQLTRLGQYKQLERKAEDIQFASASNEDFLRGCDIRVRIDTEIDSQVERVLELIERSNQLNFTKLRVDTEEKRAMFLSQLNQYGTHCGVVSVNDRYGDYGIVGFYLVRRFAGFNQLVHFVFSCRAMNMGVEQYVYETLGEPDCHVVPPVANGLKMFDTVDWIRPADAGATMRSASDAELVLLGGCDLLQVGTYCSSNRHEYVNMMSADVMVRYDDPGFILSPRESLRRSDVLPTVPCWTPEDAIRFDRDLGASKIIIVSLWEATNGAYMSFDGDILVRLAPGLLGKYVDENWDRYADRCTVLNYDLDQKLGLVTRSLDRLGALSPDAGIRFILGVNTRRVDDMSLPVRRAYNDLASHYCDGHPGFAYVSIDAVVPEQELIDSIHLTRKGYVALAAGLAQRMLVPEPA